MDVPRTPKRRHRTALFAGAAAVLVLGAMGLAQLRAAAPGLERATLWIDTVQFGELVRTVRGNGSLQPEDLRIVSALTAGRIDRVRVRPGARVTSSSVLVEMSNPDVQLQSLDAERQVKLAEADLASLRSSLEEQRLVAAGSVASATTDLHEAERGVLVAERLASAGLTAGMDSARAEDHVEEARTRYDSEKRRLEVLADALRAQLELRRAELDRLRAIARFQLDRVASMTVRAGADGVVQSLPLEPGQWVNPGQELARVAGQERLKAVVRVPESDARDVSLGQPVTVDTHDGTVRGHVEHVDPAAQGGTVAVDVALDSALPRVARADLGVDALIEIERLPHVLHMGRPGDGSSEATVSLFVLGPDGRMATRRPVRLGRGSADAVEVLGGLRAGDRVILSEMSQWNGVPRVRLQ
ncbi:MAG TPA: HlyD family efflux transporter periplasmic adaptor subunit [Candidatus Acidoferrales bacterium]|nr:HlyD family efflux transporter periplasmic adaptor subunit [Candidatus Acidoferrales bacterium]